MILWFSLLCLWIGSVLSGNFRLWAHMILWFYDFMILWFQKPSLWTTRPYWYCRLPIPVLSTHLFSIVIPFHYLPVYATYPHHSIIPHHPNTDMVTSKITIPVMQSRHIIPVPINGNQQNYSTGNVIETHHPSTDMVTSKITVPVMQSRHIIRVPIWKPAKLPYR